MVVGSLPNCQMPTCFKFIYLSTFLSHLLMSCVCVFVLGYNMAADDSPLCSIGQTFLQFMNNLRKHTVLCDVELKAITKDNQAQSIWVIISWCLKKKILENTTNNNLSPHNDKTHLSKLLIFQLKLRKQLINSFKVVCIFEKKTFILILQMTIF